MACDASRLPFRDYLARALLSELALVHHVPPVGFDAFLTRCRPVLGKLARKVDGGEMLMAIESADPECEAVQLDAVMPTLRRLGLAHELAAGGRGVPCLVVVGDVPGPDEISPRVARIVWVRRRQTR